MSRARTLRRKIERAVRRQAGAPARQPASAPAAAPLSAEQAAANRANARHSTGPRTPEGKAHSSQNALKHGLYSPYGREADDLLGQDRAVFDALLEDLREEYAPEERHEERMVERLALLWWRLQRLGAVAQTRLAARLEQGGDPVDALLQSEAIAPAEARLERAIARLHKDLLFLRRYRARERQAAAKVSARSHIAEMIAQVHAEGEALMLDARWRREAADQAARKPEPGDAEGLDGVETDELPPDGDDAGPVEGERSDRSAA